MHAQIDKPALLIAGLTAMLWGLTGIFVRLLPPYSALLVTFARLLIALLCGLLIMLLFRVARRSLIASLKHPQAYSLAALLGGYYLLATAAFQLAPVAEVALLLSTPPLFVLLLRRLRNDRPNRYEVGGALLACAGMIIIMSPGLPGDLQVANARITGDILAICAAAFTGGYAFLYRCLAEQQRAPDSLGVTLLTFLLGTFVLAAALPFMSWPDVIAQANQHTLVLFIGLGVVCTAAPSLGFAVAARRLPAVVAATISLLIPLFAGLFAWWLLNEALSPWLLPGGALVLGGMALILYRSNRAPVPLPPGNTPRK